MMTDQIARHHCAQFPFQSTYLTYCKRMSLLFTSAFTTMCLQSSQSIPRHVLPASAVTVIELPDKMPAKGPRNEGLAADIAAGNTSQLLNVTWSCTILVGALPLPLNHCLGSSQASDACFFRPLLDQHIIAHSLVTSKEGGLTAPRVAGVQAG
jgi:hypothetical protein